MEESFVENGENIGIVRCDRISEVCPGTGCLNAFFDKKEKFADSDYSDRLIGFFTCGGCPGRRVFRLAVSLKRHNIKKIHLSSCMLMEAPFSRCPNIPEIRKTLERLGIEVVDGTHHEVGQYSQGLSHKERDQLMDRVNFKGKEGRVGEMGKDESQG